MLLNVKSTSSLKNKKKWDKSSINGGEGFKNNRKNLNKEEEQTECLKNGEINSQILEKIEMKQRIGIEKAQIQYKMEGNKTSINKSKKIIN